MEIMLHSGEKRRYQLGTTVREIAASINAGLVKNAVAGKFNGKLIDLDSALNQDGKLEIITLESSDGLEIYRLSTAHVMAQAIKRLYPDKHIQLGVGTVIEDGFYYDVDIDKTFSTDDLAAIEKEMNNIIRENFPIKREVVSRSEAIDLFKQIDDELKLEIIQDVPPEAEISLYRQGEFVDLCRGPHLPSTGKIKAFKLMSVAGAYWRGNADNKMLQRIYGTAFPKKSQLDEHLQMLEEAKKRDHRKLGKELELFMFSEEAPGMPFFLPNGMTIRNELENFARKLQRERDYEEVRTPLMMNKRIWEQSGHWDHYKDNMYFTSVDDTTFALKPMNCPGHMLVYKNSLHSYRELPIRISEFGQVHRHEFSGALNGMMRVRTFCQDDAHLFVLPSQIEEEIKSTIELIDHVYQVLGFSYRIELSTRPENSMGSEELWDKAEQSLKNVLDQLKVDYVINEGDGAFYGPKIDFHILDALKRSWQCGTIQLDFQMPEKFDLNYFGEDSQKHRPVVIHRAIYGSIERFIGILTEHFAGAFPLWLSPVQVKLLPVSDRFVDYALQVKQQLDQAGIRTELDARVEKLGYKIREAQVQKMPYMLVIGEEELIEQTVAVRKRGAGDIHKQSIHDFVSLLVEEISNKQ